MSQPRGIAPSPMYASVVRDLGDPHKSEATAAVVSADRDWLMQRAEMADLIARPFDSFTPANVTQLRRSTGRKPVRGARRTG